MVEHHLSCINDLCPSKSIASRVGIGTLQNSWQETLLNRVSGVQSSPPSNTAQHPLQVIRDTMIASDNCQIYQVGAISPFGGSNKKLTARYEDSYKAQQWCLVSDSGLESEFLLVTYPDLKYAVAVDEVPGEGGQRKTKLINMKDGINTATPIARPIFRGTTFHLRRVTGGDSELYWIETPYSDGIDSPNWVLAYLSGVVTAQRSHPHDTANIWKIEMLPEGGEKFVDPIAI